MKNEASIMRPVDHGRETGMMLVSVTIVVLVLLIMVLPFLFKLSAFHRLTEKSYKTLAASQLAEAGAELAIWELNFNDITTWSGDSETRSLTIESLRAADGNEVGDVIVNVLDPESSEPVVVSSGRVPYMSSSVVERTVRIELVNTGKPFFDYGVFGEEGVTVASNLSVYGDVGTNGTDYGAISIAANSGIFGNLLCGPGGDPDLAIQVSDGSTVFGTIKAQETLKQLPSVQVPEGLTFQGPFLVETGSATLSQSGCYTSFVLNQNTQVGIAGDVVLYVTGEFSLGSNSALNLAEGSSLKVYLDQAPSMNSNCVVNNTVQDPTKLMIYGTDSLTGPVFVDSNAAFYGALYMPRADVSISSNISFHGSVYGRSVDLNSNIYVFYNEDLLDVDRLEFFTIKSWHLK